MAGSKGKITDELFQRIYRYSQAHPNKNTCEMFHISPATLNYIKRAADYKEYRESVKARSAANRAKYGNRAKTEPKQESKTLESPFGTPVTPSTSLFNKPVHIGDDKPTKGEDKTGEDKDEKIKTLEGQVTGLENKLDKAEAKARKLKKQLDSNLEEESRLRRLLRQAEKDNDTSRLKKQLAEEQAEKADLARRLKNMQTFEGNGREKELEGELKIAKEKLQAARDATESLEISQRAALGAKRLVASERDALKEALKQNMELVDKLETDLSDAKIEIAAKDEKIKSLEQRVANQRENLKKTEEVAVANERLKDKLASLERVKDAALNFEKELDDYEPVEDDEPIVISCNDHAVRNVLIGVGLAIVVAFATVALTYLIRGEF